MLVIYWVLIVIGLVWLRPFGSSTKPETTSNEPGKKFAIELSPKSIVKLSVERDGKSIEYKMVTDHWEPVAAEGKALVHNALAERIVAMITAGEQTVELVNAAPTPEDLKAFGLAPATTRMVLGTSDGKEITLDIGATNPSNLGSYAKSSLAPEVVLVGFNVSYYIDLAMEDAGRIRRQAAPAAKTRPQSTRDDRSSRLVEKKQTAAVLSRGLALLGEATNGSVGDQGRSAIIREGEGRCVEQGLLYG
jgi:hypothetical protein